MTETSKRYRIVSASFACIMWGGWAFYVNAEDGATKQIVSALTQGAASFAITLVMVRTITTLYRKLSASKTRYVFPAVITVGCTGSCAALAHYIVGTPQIVQTLSPALTVALLFGFFTTWKLAGR